MYADIAVLTMFAGLYAAIAGKVERLPLSAAMVFVAFGMIVGPLGLGTLGHDLESEGLKLVAELSLALILFVDASRADFTVLARARRIPLRLILLSLPLTIILGFVTGWVVLAGLTLLELAILATMLAPTDAALGKPVVTNRAVPAHMREGLSFESGLNDGVCVPFFLAFLTLAVGSSEAERFSALLLTLLLEEIGIGVLVGVGVSFVSALAIEYGHRRNWVDKSWLQVPVVATALTAFCAAQAVHGSGFIAAFVGGLTYGRLVGPDGPALTEPAEATGDVFTMLTWIAFGAGLVWQVLPALDGTVILYSLLSLTFVRIVPVLVVLWPLKMPMRDRLFIGWFGPRGLATVVFSMIVAAETLPGGQILLATATCTVFLSVVLHGMSALPLIRRIYGEAGQG